MTLPFSSVISYIFVYLNVKSFGLSSPIALCTFSIFLASFELSNAFQNDFSPFLIYIYPLLALSFA
jgi:hypothetical protein